MKIRIKNHESRIKGFLLSVLTMILASLFMIQPVFAVVDIKSKFGYGYINSLGEGLTKLVPATFSIATTLVVFYFLIGAFKLLTSAGDKEAVASARGMITHAIIGFVILMFVFLIFQFLLPFLGIRGLAIIQGP